MKKFIALVVSLSLPLLAGFLGSLSTAPAIDSGWYSGLIRPTFSPPNWVFGPVWTLLYLMMGVAAFLIWLEYEKITQNPSRQIEGSAIRRKSQIKTAFGIFSAQLVLNSLWSIIFFGQQNLGLALIEIIFLWLAILATIIVFARISRRAAWLLLPYLLWVSFATYLNAAFWLLN